VAANDPEHTNVDRGRLGCAGADLKLLLWLLKRSGFSAQAAGGHWGGTWAGSTRRLVQALKKLTEDSNEEVREQRAKSAWHVWPGGPPRSRRLRLRRGSKRSVGSRLVFARGKKKKKKKAPRHKVAGGLHVDYFFQDSE